MKRPHARRRSKAGLKVSRKTNTRKLTRKAQPHSFLKSVLKEAVAEAWDPTKTLQENYKNLGMCVRVNGATGGGSDDHELVVESKLEDFTELDGGFVGKDDVLGTVPTIKFAGVRKGHKALQIVEEASIIRDKDGKIVGFETSEGNVIDKKEQKPKNPFMEMMEKYVASAFKVERYASKGELDFCLECIKKHDSDYVRMAKDLKLNKFQLTPNQIKNKIEKFRKAVSDDSQ